MKYVRTFITALFVALFCLSGSAESVSRKYAQNLAQVFFNEARHEVTPPVKFVYNGKNLTMDRLFTPFYVFNSGNTGFVIISAENKTFPILGYSLTSSFNQDKLSDSQKALLSSYARDIEFIRFETDEPILAIEAWRDYPLYVKNLLSAHSFMSASTISSNEINESLTDAVNAIAETPADLYTPRQWTDIIESELTEKNEVVMGFPYKGEYRATAVTGQQGDYFRFYFDGDESWMMRILPSELISGVQIAVVGNPPVVEQPIDPEDAPFTLLDSFLAETRAVENERQLMLDELISPSKPQIAALSGGRFDISAPYRIDLVQVYNLAGAIVKQFKFRDTDSVVIDISEQPNGFYVATVFANGSQPYSFKIYR